MIDLRCDDALDVLKTLPCASLDAVITDPPYIIGATSVGNPASKSGTWADMVNAAYWFAAWYGESWRILKPTGYLIQCCNWRSLPTVLCGLSKKGIPATSCMVWDKDWIGPSYKNALRPTYELVVFSAQPDAVIPDRGASDLFRCKWMAGNRGEFNHPAEKPVELMSHLIQLVTRPGQLVCDPFMGSGTTGKACFDTGRDFIGIETDPATFAIAEQRLAATRTQNLLFAN